MAGEASGLILSIKETNPSFYLGPWLTRSKFQGREQMGATMGRGEPQGVSVTEVVHLGERKGLCGRAVGLAAQHWEHT